VAGISAEMGSDMGITLLGDLWVNREYVPLFHVLLGVPPNPTAEENGALGLGASTGVGFLRERRE